MSTYEIGSIVFDKWKICRELGQGSYGTVYESSGRTSAAFTKLR